MDPMGIEPSFFRRCETPRSDPLGPSVVPSLDVMFSRPQTKGPVAYRGADEPLAM